MIRILFLFGLLGVSFWLGLQLHNDPGYLLLAINQWTFETTLWVAAILAILAFFILHILFLSLSWLLHLPTSWHAWRTKHRAQKARDKTRQGLIEFSEGHWLQAKNHLISALPNTDLPLINYLTAARAAQEMGQNTLRDHYLREAQQSMPDAKIAVELTQAQLQLAHRQWEQALATLKHLQDLAPHHPYVLKLLMNLYEEIRDWPQLIALLPELKRYKIIEESAYTTLQQRAYAQAFKELQKQAPLNTIQAWIKQLPTVLNHDPELISDYSRYLLALGAEKDAEAQLRDALRHQIDDRLLELYGQINGNPNALAFAESLLKETPHKATLFLCLGRLCKTLQLWGKARTYFETSIHINPTPVAYAELGQLMTTLNDESAASRAYQQGLLLAIQ